jgi:drug/metabolite transporter (DMT)-like permease
LIALQGVVLSYVGTLFWYGAVTRLDLARATSIVVPSVPLLSIAASFVLLGEVPSPAQWCGLAMTAIGVFAFVTAPHALPRPDAEPQAQSVASAG